MKKTDIAMIILIVSISALVSYFVIGSIPGLKDANKPVKVKTIDKYQAKVDDPDPKVFSGDAINPTVQVTIGGADDMISSNSSNTGTNASGQTNASTQSSKKLISTSGPANSQSQSSNRNTNSSAGTSNSNTSDTSEESIPEDITPSDTEGL